MSFMTKIMGTAAALAMSATAALAEPALIFDLGGKFDKSFNEAAHNGAQRWAEETGGSYREIELQSEAQREQALRRFAESGANPVITMGFAMADALSVVAPEYPDTKFVAVDVTWLEAPNIRQIGFAEHEGSYLVGMMAAMASETGTVGFVGGMDIPLIRHFGCGYAQGVKAVNPDATIIANMTGTTPAAWNDPVKGSELTKAQISQGADVVYAAAGGTGVGVLRTAADEGILSIGVDSNQNYLHPGQVLTSMLKRVDVAVYDAMKAGADLETGVFTMGLANDGVGYALDEFNAELVSDEMKAAVDAAREKIINGDLEVVAYYTNDNCPAIDF
ncbi:BMP family lipoprotein [Aestuariivita boseongensis]|uniref:BMP family lipoprotein n=1 Tax=Aestuariivita boseongensis TaxID=1470562 RepID=UPI000681A5F3|nr:BMP family ABC transporter substrate-binding protein [Aestuariivita boseongensis]